MPEPKRVAIVGAGSVGTSIAYGLLMRETVTEILLVDLSNDLLHAQVFDLSEAASGTTVTVRAGTFKEAGQADIIIITADVPKQENEPRAQWIAKNRRLFSSLVRTFFPVQPRAIIIVATEPVDIGTRTLQEGLSLPRSQIFGAGSITLSTARIRYWMSQITGVFDESKVQVYVMGTKDVPVLGWSCASVDDEPARSMLQLTTQRGFFEQLSSNDRINYISAHKGDAWFAKAAVVVKLVETIVFGEPTIQVLCVYVEQFKTCISVPVVLGPRGVQEEVLVGLSADEQQALETAAKQSLKDFEDSVAVK